jgi:hypothetical protein
MTRSPVTHYGVHWAPGAIAYLHQARGDQNAIGLREGSPFFVRTPKRATICNHLVQLNAINPAREHLTLFRQILLHDSLARFMLPLPKDAGGPGVARITGAPNMLHLTLLAKMSSPVRKPFLRADFAQPKQIADELEVTNIQPLVLLDVKPEHMRTIGQVMRIAEDCPRRLLICAHGDVPVRAEEVSAPRMELEDQTSLVALPWETLGAIVLRAWMRVEWDVSTAWFKREPVPANEPKPSRPLPGQEHAT